MASLRRVRRVGPPVERRWAALVVFGAATFITALIGSLAAGTAAGVYDQLARPAWAPPAWVFGPVWTLLYAAIAVAGWLVWLRVGLDRVLWPYAAQLVLNAAWTPIFFGARAYGWAIVEIAALWVVITVTVVWFWRVRPLAALLLAPYWAWVGYAAALTVALWRANP